MKSMTGYGYSELQNDKLSLSLEMKSYNNRYLDVLVNIPAFLGPLEPRIREFISSKVDRGRVEVYLRLKELEEDLTVHLDKSAARAYSEVLRELAEVTGAESRLHISHLLKLEGILKIDKTRDIESIWQLLEPLLVRTITEFEASRMREGKMTGQDIIENISVIETNLRIIETRAPELEQYIKDNLRQRFEELMGQGADESRIYAETAVLLVKYSINEEIVRMKAHLESFRDTAGQDIPVGRKLDFICQELNREINTIGSKSVLIEINQAVIEVKDSLEKIREQLRNVE